MHWLTSDDQQELNCFSSIIQVAIQYHCSIPGYEAAMGIYERVNRRYSKTLYQNEFDQQWRTWKEVIGSLGLVGATMVSHDKTMDKVNSKRDIYVDGATAFGYLLDSIERKSIPLNPDDIMIPAMVHSVYRVTPPEGLRYQEALRKMIESGQIPENLVNRSLEK
jgi:hypothetical protein